MQLVPSFDTIVADWGLNLFTCKFQARYSIRHDRPTMMASTPIKFDWKCSTPAHVDVFR